MRAIIEGTERLPIDESSYFKSSDREGRLKELAAAEKEAAAVSAKHKAAENKYAVWARNAGKEPWAENLLSPAKRRRW